MPIVTRTIEKRAAHTWVFSKDSKDCFDSWIPTEEKTCDKALYRFRKNLESESFKYACVDEIKVERELYGMDESVFMAHSNPVEKRDSATNDMITKTVVGYAWSYAVVDAARQIKSAVAYLPIGDKDKAEKKLAKLEKAQGRTFVGIDSVERVEEIRAMSYDTFMQYAKPMIDAQHFKPEEKADA